MSADRSAKLRPFLPRLTIRWIAEQPELRQRTLEGTVVFVDISGFTKMSERLARLGRVGAEEVTDVVGFVFRRLLATAYANGGGLIKFGGDALLLFFSGETHAADGVAAAIGMRRTLAEMGQIDTSAGKVRLRMSVGVHSGEFHFFLVGDRHRELLLTGPGASTVVTMEGTADAGQIVISPQTAAQVPSQLVSGPKGDGLLLRRNLRLSDADDRSYEPEPQLVPGSCDLVDGIPVALRDLLLHGYGEPEHRRVTIGFIHYDGTDELIEAEADERVADALSALVSAAQTACDDHGVTFLATDVDHDGGKIILVAGAPTAAGDDEARMLAALRQVQATQLRIPIRVGVNTGPVFAGDIGPSYRRTYTVMGDAVNLAARVMGKAEPGQILASQAVLDACSMTFETTELEPFLVKGKTFPVYASVIGEPRGAKAGDEHDELPLIGRDFETGILKRTVDSAMNGEGWVIEVVGPPGIGKTRLHGELRATAGDMRQLTAACDLYGASTPYAAFRPLLRQALDLPADASRDATVSRLMQTVWNRAPELSPWLPLLAVPLDIELPTTPEVEQLGQEFRRARLNDVVTTLLGRLLIEPTLIAVEDTHWMDEASSDLFRQLCRDINSRPWLIAVTRRDEATGFAAPTSEATVSVRPDWLSEDQVVELLIAATEDAPLRPHEMSILARRSGGNPLFLQELLNATQAQGGTEGLPDTVEAMVTSQIDQLASDYRRRLRYASVLGMRFRTSLADELLGGTLAADPSAWRRLGEFVVKDGPEHHRFRHALMRDAAYEGLPYRLRRELHARAGETIERLRSTPDEYVDLLALHFFHARANDKAWRYAREAAAGAESKFAIVDAAEHLERALQSARGIEDMPDTDVAEVLEQLADLRERMGEYPAAREAYRRAQRLRSADAVALARLYMKQAIIADRVGSYPQALSWLQRGIKLVADSDDLTAAKQRARLMADYGAVRQAQGRRADAVSWLNRAIEAAQEADEREALAQALFVLDWALVDLGRGDEATHSQRALELYDDMGKLAPQASIYNNLGMFAYREGRWDEAVEWYEKSKQLRLRVGAEVDAAMGTFNVAEILSDRGQLDEARAGFEEAGRVFRAAEMAFGVACVDGALGTVASRSGDYPLAHERFDASRAKFEAMVSEHDLIDTDGFVAESLVLQGRASEALKLAGSCLERTAAYGGDTHDPALHRIRGYAWSQLGDIESAQRELECSLELARARSARYQIALTLDAIARVSERAGAVDAAARAEADELFSMLGVIRIAEVPLGGTPATRV